MKHILLKMIAFVVIISVISSSSVLFAGAAGEQSTTPVVYVVGVGTPIGIRQEDGTTNTIFPPEIPEGYIEQFATDNLSVFSEAMATQKWDTFCDLLYNAAAELFDGIALDVNGNPTSDTVILEPWIIPNDYDGHYDIDEYIYYYDFRLDPYVLADELHTFIEQVLSATGRDKVALIGRCLGANVAMAYLDKYDCEYVSDLFLYCGTQCGAVQCSKAFCGELYLDSDAIERFMYDMDLSENYDIDTFIKAFVSVFNATYGLDITAWAVNNAMPRIYPKIGPRFLRATFGTFPGFWTMVSNEDYEKAKETIFPGELAEEWAPFIEIIDNYHNRIGSRVEEFLKGIEAKGINIFNVVKYGKQTIPVTSNGSALSDSMVNVEDASIGATTTGVNADFSKKYLRAAEKNETIKYISPDNQIDASTCLFKDRTWFVKNISHLTFPRGMHPIFIAALNGGDDFTVESDKNFPQYFVYDGETDTITPMTPENNGTERWNISFFQKLKNFFVSAYSLIREWITGMLNKDAAENLLPPLY